MMELKEYQTRALDAFVRWRRTLEEAARDSRRIIAMREEAGEPVSATLRDWPRGAWARMANVDDVADRNAPYAVRTDDAGRPIPHVCLKVPTGGGKTLLAAAALERLDRPTGLTLWVVPTRAIYGQTLAALRDRQHPYRQMLERASGGRVMVMEKDDRFSALDAANYLCVMLLMLPAANRRRGREFLRMFRDSGRYPTLFPKADDVLGDARLLAEHPDLERVSPNGPVKRSLFNVFKMLRPVVVLDEAHKAYGRKRAAGEEFARAIGRLDPRMVIELSATPNRGISNLLVDIGGAELKAEEMIKLPIRVTSFSRVEWRYVLERAHDELERIDADARGLEAREGRYIRPLAVVRVERTGKDQRDGERVHAEDVREYLMRLGVPERAIAVKSAERDELARVDLLSPYTPVRWVITRAALMEGWDCPFAYVLAMLDNTTARRALTQLVGRVMRQPHARRTGLQSLDTCHVFCWNTSVGEAVEQVKRGLEEEGLTGLGGEVVAGAADAKPVTVRRREAFRDRDIFLPRVLHRDGGGGWRELDYTRHVLPELDWGGIGAPDPDASQAESALVQSAAVDIGDSPLAVAADRTLEVDATVRLTWFARRLSDVVPNAWQAARVAGSMLEALRAQGETDRAIYDRRSWLAYALRRHVAGEVERRAERLFREKLGRGDIRFDLNAGRRNFRMVESFEIAVPEDSGVFARATGEPLQLNLFEPLYMHQFDSALERNFARYMDEQSALRWWHRVAARQGGDYYLKGWRRDRIWPDFVALRGEAEGRPHLLVFETKGRHLENSDTAYKERVMKTLEGAFNCGAMTVRGGPAKGVFRLVFDEAEFPAAVAAGLEEG